MTAVTLRNFLIDLSRMTRLEVKPIAGIPSLNWSIPPSSKKSVLNVTIEKSQPFFLELALSNISQLLLRSLVVDNIPCRQQILRLLKKAGQLEILEITQWDAESDSFFQLISSTCQELKVLKFTKALLPVNISPISNCVKISDLDLSYNFSLLEEGLVKFLTVRGSRLEKLNLFSCDSLTEKSIAAIVQYCPQIKVLNVGNILDLPPEAFRQLATIPLDKLYLGKQIIPDCCMERFLQCKELSLNGCVFSLDQVTADGTSRLEFLNLIGCKFLSLKQVEFLVRKLNCLKCIQICDGSLTAEDLYYLENQFPNVNFFA